MSDLELGMNEVMSDPFVWDDAREYDRGKVYHAEDLDRIEKFGRYRATSTATVSAIARIPARTRRRAASSRAVRRATNTRATRKIRISTPRTWIVCSIKWADGEDARAETGDP